MHELQKKLLRLAVEKNIELMTLREMGEYVGETHPQKIKHHLDQLRNKGLLTHGNKPRSIGAHNQTTRMISIPILGAANCGDPRQVAIENFEGYLTVSPRMIPKKKQLFAVRALGSSMNKANFAGKSIEDGDYVIIDSEDREPKNNDYVISIIDGAANIKKFCRDTQNNQIVLLSESTKEFPPIYIHEDDFVDYMVNGKVVQVIKKVRG